MRWNELLSLASAGFPRASAVMEFAMLKITVTWRSFRLTVNATPAIVAIGLSPFAPALIHAIEHFTVR